MLHQSGSVISTTNFREDLYSSTTPSASVRCWISFTPMWCCAMVALPPPGTQPSPAWPCLRSPASCVFVLYVLDVACLLACHWVLVAAGLLQQLLLCCIYLYNACILYAAMLCFILTLLLLLLTC
ncbi:hypothetical protein VPH35_031600 [Triticum aestivum]